MADEIGNARCYAAELCKMEENLKYRYINIFRMSNSWVDVISKNLSLQQSAMKYNLLLGILVLWRAYALLVKIKNGVIKYY